LSFETEISAIGMGAEILFARGYAEQKDCSRQPDPSRWDKRRRGDCPIIIKKKPFTNK